MNLRLMYLRICTGGYTPPDTKAFSKHRPDFKSGPRHLTSKPARNRIRQTKRMRR